MEMQRWKCLLSELWLKEAEEKSNRKKQRSDSTLLWLGPACWKNHPSCARPARPVGKTLSCAGPRSGPGTGLGPCPGPVQTCTLYAYPGPCRPLYTCNLQQSDGALFIQIDSALFAMPVRPCCELQIFIQSWQCQLLTQNKAFEKRILNELE